MIKRILTYKVPLLITLCLFVFHFVQKDFNNRYERPIAGDAQAYYAYLPALFIYHDLSYDFLDEINDKYYPTELQKNFLKEEGAGKVNKTFPGVTLLYLPFFAIAHSLAVLFGLPSDGYSAVYQVLFDIGLWCYLLLGLVFLMQILKKLDFQPKTIHLTLLILVLGTNMFFYSVYDQSVTHIYNFFLVNGCILALFKFKESATFKWLGLAILSLALMAITRPTNFLVLGLILFFFPTLAFYQSAFKVLFTWKNGIKVLLIVLPILAIPFLLWKAQTGLWIVYSYGDEVFDFTQPHLSEFLFSYFKGWFTYTPLAFFALLIGFYFLWKENRKQFVIGIVFYAVCIYIFSSWWCWYYGAGMSQRVMIDHYILLAFLIALILKKSTEITALKFTLIGVFGITILLNVVQAYQIRYGILNGGSATKEKYWDNFLMLEKRARVYPLDDWRLLSKNEISLNPLDGNIGKGQPHEIEGEWMIEVNSIEHYSASIDLRTLDLKNGSQLAVSFDARARTDIKETRLVLVVDGVQHVFGLDYYLKKDEWIRIEWLFEPENQINTFPTIYFWNGGSNEKVEFKSFKIEHYFSEKFG